MDGTLGDKFGGDRPARRIRPVTFEYAVANFPKLIVRLKQGRLLLSSQSSREGPETILLYDPKRIENRWFLLKSDFDIVKKISDESVLRLFPSDTEKDIEARILVKVKLEFRGRGIPT